MKMRSTEPFVRKYLPKSRKEVIGQDSAVNEIVSFIKNYKSERNKALLLYGATGTGKTSSIHAVASEEGLEIVEVNASDFRNASQIEAKAGNALKQQSLFSKGKMLLLDDVDGLSGAGDRGGVQAILKLMENSRYPIIMTATEIEEGNGRQLAKKCRIVEFKKLDYDSVFIILKKVCENEAINLNDDVIREIAYYCGGDARAAINDLQSLVSIESELTVEKVKEINERNKKDSITSALKKIFKTSNLNIALRSFDSIDEDSNEKIMWIDENIPKEYSGKEDIAKSYYALSRADVFSRRIRRRGYYRFLVYINALLSGGIALSKEKKYSQQVDYKRSERPLRIWISNQKLSRKKSIAGKISLKTHQSKKDAIKSLMPWISYIARNKKNMELINAEFELDDDEIEWVKKMLK